MPYTKENKRELRSRLEALHRPVIVAGEGHEALARLHAAILANGKVPESAQKYARSIKSLASSTVDIKDENGHVVYTRFLTHKELVLNLRRSTSWRAR